MVQTAAAVPADRRPLVTREEPVREQIVVVIYRFSMFSDGKLGYNLFALSLFIHSIFMVIHILPFLNQQPSNKDTTTTGHVVN